MRIERPKRHMTLREHITHTEKVARDLAVFFKENLIPSIAEFRDLTRPVRRRSNYPTRQALQNNLGKLEQSGTEAMMLCGFVLDEMKHIGDSTKREIQLKN